MQQPPHTLTAASQLPPANITTEQIQKYLDENKQLILAILDNQNLGKLSECAQYQAILQKNLLYLAAIADAQPQAAAIPSQMLPPAAMQQGGVYPQQPPIFPPKASSQFNPQQMQVQQPPHQLQQQSQLIPVQGHIAMRPVANNSMRAMHAEGTLGGSGGPLPTPNLAEFPRGATSSSSLDGRGSRHEPVSASEPASVDAHGSSPTEIEHGDERSEDGKTP